MTQADTQPHVVIVLYSGNYHAAWQQIQRGEKGTWYGHPYMVNVFSRLRQHMNVTVLTCKSETATQVTLDDGTRVIQVGCSHPEQETEKIIKAIAANRPTHLIFRAPLPKLWRWASHQADIRTMALLAQSYTLDSLRKRIKTWQIARILNHPAIEWVFNHQTNASKSLQQIGVHPHKIIPWDWDDTPTGLNLPAKETLPPQPWTLLYVGSITEPKGVGDLIRAIAHLRHRGYTLHLHLAGKGQMEAMQQLAHRLGVADLVTHLGLIPNEEIIQTMHDATLVAVPSRHRYPEGFPMTICEALESRTPIIASDHPMFHNILVHQRSAMIFPSGQAEKISACIQTLLSSPQLYTTLSQNSEATWKGLRHSVVLWTELIERWVRNSESDRQWLAQYSLKPQRQLA